MRPSREAYSELREFICVVTSLEKEKENVGFRFHRLVWVTTPSGRHADAVKFRVFLVTVDIL